ncbi:MAG: FxsA family protein [Gammaproteobacteria bacterium]|nr:FxsA family protein [Gammaproteobacteria bacterium]MBT8134011.1 FxsA family protein [Gammaproteobacteria bacterium]NNJ50804.1 FxsA family protein [Gammaproteobacteria bacterium]
MPLLFIAIPLIELYFIIVVGEAIGAFWTVMLVILTAVVGVSLLRIQGMSTLMRAQRNMAQGQIPAMEMMEGIALAVAGVLLITPGFITDSIGMLCLIPASRQAIIRYIMARASVHGSFNATMGGFESHHQPGNKQQHGDTDSSTGHRVGRTIEGEYKRED